VSALTLAEPFGSPQWRLRSFLTASVRKSSEFGERGTMRHPGDFTTGAKQ